MIINFDVQIHWSWFKQQDLRHTRSSQPEVFWKKGVFRNFAKFVGKHLCQSLFFNSY